MYIIIAGGTFVYLPNHVDQYVIDASGSIAGDISPYDAVQYSYVWSCTIGSISGASKPGPSYGDNCDGIFDESIKDRNISAVALSTANMQSIILNLVQVSMFATTVNSSVSESEIVKIIYANAAGASKVLPPLVTMTSTFSKFVSNRIVPLSATFSSQPSVDDDGNIFNISWAKYDASYNNVVGLEECATSQVSRTVVVKSTFASTFDFILSLKPNCLLSNTRYIFRVFPVNLDGLSADILPYSEIAIQGNGPPSSGIVQASPSHGFSSNTSYTLSASLWIDDLDDYPLLYSFEYCLQDLSAPTNATFEFKALSFKNMRSYIKTFLPGANTNKVNKLFVNGVITDRLGASSDMYTDVTVIPDSVAVEALNNSSLRYNETNISTKYEEYLQLLPEASSRENSYKTQCINQYSPNYSTQIAINLTSV